MSCSHTAVPPALAYKKPVFSRTIIRSALLRAQPRRLLLTQFCAFDRPPKSIPVRPSRHAPTVRGSLYCSVAKVLLSFIGLISSIFYIISYSSIVVKFTNGKMHKNFWKILPKLQTIENAARFQIFKIQRAVVV